MSSLIAWGQYLVTETGDQPSILEKGAIYAKDGIIREMGPYSVLKERHPATPEIGSSDVVVLPGLVNAHHHGGGYSFSPRRRRQRHRSLELRALAKGLPAAEDPYWYTLYSCMKLMESGVTTVVHSHPDRYPEDYEWRAERTLQAYCDAGIRVAFALSTVNQNNFVYASDEEFLKRLPSDLRLQLQAAIKTRQPVSGERFFTTFRKLWERFDQNGEGRVRILLAPLGPQWCTNELLVECKRIADRCGTGIHMHLLETMYQKLYGLKQYGESALAHLAHLGLVGERVSYAHGVWLTERDAQILGETRTSIVHNPSSNLRLGSGIAPVRMLLKHGVNIAIGTDSASINEDEDLWTEMRLGWYLHRLPGIYPDWPGEGQVLRMATANGARVALFGEQVGSLVPGKRADLIQVRVPTHGGGIHAEASSILGLLLARTTRLDVATVIVDGDVLMRDGELLHLDRSRVLDALRRAKKVSVSSSAALAELSDMLVPYAEAFYREWDVGQLDPLYRPNSRI